MCSIEHFVKYFGERIYDFVIVLFTWKDELDNHKITLHEYINSSPPTLHNFLQRCGGRVCAFNNTLTGEAQQPQVEELISTISKNVITNGNTCYTTDMYIEAENEINEVETERRQEKKEETLKKTTTFEKLLTENPSDSQIDFNQVYLTQNTEASLMSTKIEEGRYRHNRAEIAWSNAEKNLNFQQVKIMMKPNKERQRNHALLGELFLLT